MGEDGYKYPTDEDLKTVAEFRPEWIHHGKTPLYGPWFVFIRSLWWAPDWGWREYDGFDDGDPVRVFQISTGGWSGNEDLIEAMASNFICWGETFNVQKRGGHFEFMVRDPSRRRRNQRIKEPVSADAVDPHAASTGKPSTPSI